MPSKKTTTKKTAAKKPKKSVGAAKRPTKRVARKRTVKKSELLTPLLSQIPEPPKPEPIQDIPKMDMLPEEGTAVPPEPQDPTPSEPVDEVKPVISDRGLSAVQSRVSFYLGVVTGAAVLHVLVFALVAIVTS